MGQTGHTAAKQARRLCGVLASEIRVLLAAPQTASNRHRRDPKRAAVTNSRWELTIVLVVSSTSFWSIWHFVAQLLN
jgi:hypothetical protein